MGYGAEPIYRAPTATKERKLSSFAVLLALGLSSLKRKRAAALSEIEEIKRKPEEINEEVRKVKL